MSSLICSVAVEEDANTEDAPISDLSSHLAVPIMNGADPTIIDPRHGQHTSDLSHYARHAHSSSTSNAASTAATAPTSSITPRPAPPATVPRAQEAPHIRFRGSSAPQNPRNEQALSSEPSPQPHTQEQQRPNIPPPSPRLHPVSPSISSLNGSLPSSPKIKVKDLRHIQSFASEEVLTRSRHPSRHSLRGRWDGGQQYEISAMPVTDIIEMVAGLLTKITTTNDKAYEHLHRQPPDGSAGLSQQASSVLAFHGKNVPAITIASYLTRIHKYCPTTYEVFLSLLVYFDRMTEMVNNGSQPRPPEDEKQPGSNNRDPSTDSHESTDTVRQDSPMDTSSESSSSSDHPTNSTSSSMQTTPTPADAYDISHFFVVDSFNIHRLVMAAVTCASKFFSDVFYTNSRYAKVSLHYEAFLSPINSVSLIET